MILEGDKETSVKKWGVCMKQREWQGKGLGPCRRVSGKNSITEREWGSREAKMREDQGPEETEVRGGRHQVGTDHKVEQEEDKSSGQRG